MLEANFEEVNIAKKKESSYIFARVSVNGSIRFTGSAFSILYAFLNSGVYELDAKFYRDNSLVSDGKLNLMGEINAEEKVADLKFTVTDPFVEMFKKWSEDMTVKGMYWQQIYIEVLSETKTVEKITESVQAPEPENNYLWRSTFPLNNGTWRHTYTKQMINFPADTWDYDPDLEGDYVEWPVYDGYSKDIYDPVVVSRALNYCVSLAEMLFSLLDNIDSVGIDVNDFCSYLQADDELQNVLIGNKGSIKEGSNIEKDENINLKELLIALKQLFNLDWKIAEGLLRLYHPSEISLSLPSFTTLPFHDLTDLHGINWSKNTIHYKGNNLPYKEAWSLEPSFDDDFDGKPITYNINSEKAIEYKLSKFNNNIEKVLLGGEGVSDTGFIVVATDSAYKIIHKPGIFQTDKMIPNGKLTTSRLIVEHQMNGDRHLPTGEFNGEVVEFTNIKPMRSMIGVNVAGATIDSFDFDYLVRTEVGNMKLVSVIEKCNGEMTEIQLEI